MKWLKRIGIAILILVIVAGVGLSIFMYKAKNGFASYETSIPEIEFTSDKFNILLFSKTTAFRHGAAISASITSLERMAEKNDWFLYTTEAGGVFNPKQLNQFDVVIWNNSTGPVLNEEQRQSFKNYIIEGGGYVGIHGAGDFSHKWNWYNDQMISAEFSHHPIKNHIQQATVYKSEGLDSSWMTPPVWSHKDEWYIFHNTPTQKGAQVLHFIDGETIDPNGDLLWMKGKDFGMGKEHPVVWIKKVGQGRSFYTSMGHSREAFSNKNFLAILEEGIKWAGNNQH